MADADAVKTHADVPTGPRGRVTVEGEPSAATRTAGLLGGILSYTVEQGFIETNPMSHEGSTLCAKSLNKDRGNHPSRRMIGATSLT